MQGFIYKFHSLSYYNSEVQNCQLNYLADVKKHLLSSRYYSGTFMLAG